LIFVGLWLSIDWFLWSRGLFVVLGVFPLGQQVADVVEVVVVVFRVVVML
jgi:hypothetical protein